MSKKFGNMVSQEKHDVHLMQPIRILALLYLRLKQYCQEYFMKTILFLCWIAVFGAYGQIKVFTEELPPYQYTTTKLKGVSVEIVRAIMKKVGEPDNITVNSWNRAYLSVQSEKDVAVFPASRTPQREALFQWVGPIFQASNRFIRLKDSRSNSIASFTEAKKLDSIGVVSNSSRHIMLRDQGFKNLIIHYNSDENYRALFNRRVEMIIANPLIAEFQSKALGFDVRELEDTGFELYHSDVYIIFNKESDPKVVKKWQDALDSLKKDGSYQKIYDDAYAKAQKNFGIL